MKKIEYYHKNSDVIAYEKTIKENDYWEERTYDEKGNKLTFKDSYGNCNERIYDEKGNELTFKNSDGYWSESTYDENGNQLTFKDSYDLFLVKGKSVTKEEFEAFTEKFKNN